MTELQIHGEATIEGSEDKIRGLDELRTFMAENRTYEDALRPLSAPSSVYRDHDDSHPGYTRHALPAFLDADRCKSVSDGYRCQMLAHDDDHHVACTVFDVSRTPVAKYALWGAPYANGESILLPGVAPLRWAATFPRVES